MSTQSAPSILFTHTAPQQGFRLLELPPEVADLLTSDHPPTFYLKTPTPTTAQPTTSSSSSSSRPTDSREYVNLCTPTQTYRIRQVQSSNSLHILRPSGMGGRDTVLRREDLAIVDGDGDMDVDVDVDVDVGVDLAETVTTIAKCGSTLELHVPEGGFRAAEFLGALVGRFAPGMSAAAATGSAREREMEGGAGAAEDGKVMETVFTDIPVSRAECERVWVEGCAFVWRGRAWVPTPEVRMEVWKRMVDGAVVQGIDLRTQFLVDDLWKSVVVEDEDEDGQIPRALFEAIVRRVVEGEEGKSLLGEKLKWASLDREVCVRWVGETYLEAMAPMASAAVGRSEFLNAWKDHLPEAWREEVALAKLTDAVYQLPDPTTISFVTEFERQRSKKNLPTDASAATAAKKSRNWHELFKNQKRQKR
ncbi:sister chromatid cohesion protein Dcc1 [Aspergillus violaceofuscus CBS 115571]|uniref:Sister chromatid cohesion protein Dcc1 n=1 Tax=Aspergillus violaceofuscus (strain CBS 115571) TaxID=1450538 RepID=A0A2V5IAS1_ASPV1|nr:sister chromatid cohesion protein Dcc1 [Aspergillus violaceofuscus CBS 115571]